MKEKINNQMIAAFVLPVIAILISWLAFYLIQKKLNNPDSSTAWGGLIVLSVFALIFIFLTAASWFGLYIQGKSVDVYAEFTGVKPDTVFLNTQGEKIYKWRLECRWNDPMTGKLIMFKSEPFEGTNLHYGKSKIKVATYPLRADKFYTVDLSELTTGPGIELITKEMIMQADEKFDREQLELKKHTADQELRKEKSHGMAVMINRAILLGTAILISLGLAIGVWLYFRYNSSQNHVEELISATKNEFEAKGWNFSFQPYPYVWRGLQGMMQPQPVKRYPSGSYEIKGSSENIKWIIEVLIPDIYQQSGRYRSTEELWLQNASHSQLALPLRTQLKNGFFLWMEIPASFSTAIKSSLLQPHSSTREGYLNDITKTDDRQLLLNYIGKLFDPSTSIIRRATAIKRLGEPEINKVYVTLVGDQFPVTSIITSKMKRSLSDMADSERGGYGILIAPDKIIVTIINEVLKPDQAQILINIGLELRAELEKQP